MKLKMRFDKDDMVKFGIYALVLFFMVAILYSNLLTFADTGELAGLNFFKALSLENIGATLVIFLICLGGLVFSCKSYFFEFDKGFGFSTEKKLEGYSKWCDKKTNTYYYELGENGIIFEYDTSSKFNPNGDLIKTLIILFVIVVITWVLIFILNKNKNK